HCLYSVCGRPTTIFYIAGNKTVCLISFRDTPNMGEGSFGLDFWLNVYLLKTRNHLNGRS
ncbi:MAG: hypothetical protein ORN54_01580, partial [Cyclobacteriaceae bacterium]|nr:hypothetical protein [Cyclobacteriaceae bacterium]